jgi:hypothetical protein
LMLSVTTWATTIFPSVWYRVGRCIGRSFSDGSISGRYIC